MARVDVTLWVCLVCQASLDLERFYITRSNKVHMRFCKRGGNHNIKQHKSDPRYPCKSFLLSGLEVICLQIFSGEAQASNEGDQGEGAH